MKAQDAANGELSNGDKLTIHITAPEDTENDLEKYIIRKYGVKPEKLEKEYTVSGLDELEEFDPFEKLDVRFTGRSPFVNLELVNNNEIYGIEFLADQTEGLAIDDDVVITAVGAEGEVLENICATQGKKLVQDKKTYVVENVDSYVEKLEDISQEEMDKMEKTARSAVEDAVMESWYWSGPEVTLVDTEFIGNYFLRAKKNADVDNYAYIFFVYKITGTAENGKSYTSYSYSRFRGYDSVE